MVSPDKKGRKGNTNKKGEPVLIKPGPSGKILVVEDVDGSFTQSITRAGSVNKGSESGNKMWFITNEDDKEAFDQRYSKGNSNLNDARSSAGKNGLRVVYGVDPTKMQKDPELAETVVVKKFRRAHLIHPRYTNRDKIWEKEEKIAVAGGAAKKETPREQTLKDEEEAKKKALCDSPKPNLFEIVDEIFC